MTLDRHSSMTWSRAASGNNRTKSWARSGGSKDRRVGEGNVAQVAGVAGRVPVSEAEAGIAGLAGASGVEGLRVEGLSAGCKDPVHNNDASRRGGRWARVVGGVAVLGGLGEGRDKGV
jgi:hypothetical protein